jgi:hypothetical protein
VPRNFSVREQFSRPWRPHVECGAFLTSHRDERKFMSFVCVGVQSEGRFGGLKSRQLSSSTSTLLDTSIARFPPWSIDSRVCYGARQHGFGNGVAISAFRKGFRNKRNMFKISTIDTPSQRTLVVEGTLIGSWVAELRTTWRTASQELNGRKLVIDLSSLTVISIEGEDAILDLMREGAKFSRGGILTRHVLKQLTRKKQQELPRR